MERPNPDDDSALPPDPAPGSDPEPTPRYPKRPKVDPEVRPERISDNTRVTPLDEDKNIEGGIDVNET